MISWQKMCKYLSKMVSVMRHALVHNGIGQNLSHMLAPLFQVNMAHSDTFLAYMFQPV